MLQSNCKPKHSVMATTPGERALAGIAKTKLHRDPETTAESDLVGDTFYLLHNRKSWLRKDEDIHQSRRINRRLLEWASDKTDFQNMLKETQNRFATAAISAGLVWASLTDEDSVKDAMKANEQAEQMRMIAQKLLEQAAAESDEAKADAMRDEAGKHNDMAGAVEQQAIDDMDQYLEHPLAQANFSAKMEEVKEQAQGVNSMIKNWGCGTEPGRGGLSPSDIDTIMDMADSKVLQELAKIIGRSSDVSMNEMEQEKLSYVGAVSRLRTTGRIDKALQTERIYLSDKAPLPLRATKINQLANSSLVGWQNVETLEKNGATIIFTDESGSMGQHGNTKAKGIAMGLARAKKQVFGSEYELYGFGGGENFPSVMSTDDWREHVKWGSTFMCDYSTDFNAAFTLAIERIQLMKDNGVDGVDLTFISDGIASFDRSVLLAWHQLVAELETRLCYVKIGGYENKELEELADLTITVPDSVGYDGKSVVKAIAKQMAQGNLSM